MGLLHGAGSQRLTVNSLSISGCPGAGVLATRTAGADGQGSQARLFIYNHFFSGENGTVCNTTLQLNGLDRDTIAHATLVRIDADHANPKKTFEAMGSPEYPSIKQTEE